MSDSGPWVSAGCAGQGCRLQCALCAAGPVAGLAFQHFPYGIAEVNSDRL